VTSTKVAIRSETKFFILSFVDCLVIGENVAKKAETCGNLKAFL
jgi:hypothetical protein